jgi:hypothetical protein
VNGDEQDVNAITAEYATSLTRASIPAKVAKEVEQILWRIQSYAAAGDNAMVWGGMAGDAVPELRKRGFRVRRKWLSLANEYVISWDA